MDTQIEIDLGLSQVSDGALAILERTGGATKLPPRLFSGLLDALAAEHLRRFGSLAVEPARLTMSRRELDTDDLWHSLRLLGNWLSYTEEASREDRDLDAACDVIARMWMGMSSALCWANARYDDEPGREIGN
ncbi:MAG TPA: hypothetical protein VKT27_04165 [Candidatus Binataceae bacterium]|nr:hypothetical protein [Candidatus Binataceae bacterium]